VTLPFPDESAGPWSARFSLPAGHPCLPGHFPGRPVVPGVVLLDRVLEAARGAGLGRPARLPSAKFLRPVGPEEEVVLTLRRTGGGRIAFTGHVGEALAFSGELDPAPAA
jgi:3-hydroxymyristoyl/3-hydroxydecanoyl-(acyl carrier protein) dehydratase